MNNNMFPVNVSRGCYYPTPMHPSYPVHVYPHPQYMHPQPAPPPPPPPPPQMAMPCQPILQYHYIQPPQPHYQPQFQPRGPIHRVHHFQPPPPQLRSIEIRSPNTLSEQPVPRTTTQNTVVDGVNTFTGELLTHEPNEPEPDDTPTTSRPEREVVTLRDLLQNSTLAQCTQEQSCEQCSICQTSFNDQIIRTLPCNHCFHALCIDEWFCTHNTCPLCRVPLTTTAWAATDDSII